MHEMFFATRGSRCEGTLNRDMLIICHGNLYLDYGAAVSGTPAKLPARPSADKDVGGPEEEEEQADHQQIAGR